MSLAYKVEELLALRGSASESAVSIEKFVDEDTIKEHVLRPSVSAQLVRFKSDRSIRPTVSSTALPEPAREVSAESAPATTPVVPEKRPSPSPSFKRGKAEMLLKEHGSPPGLRVTAGGRVVPGDLPPLGGARHGYHVYNPQVLRATAGNTMSAQPPPNMSSTARIEVLGGQPFVVLGDHMIPLSTANTSTTPTPMAIGTADAACKQSSNIQSLSAQDGSSVPSAGTSRESSLTPSSGLDLQTLKAQQLQKKQDLRAVEQTEVLQASQQSESWRVSMIEKKRALIVELDKLRKQIVALETKNAALGQSNSVQNTAGTATGSTPLLPMAPQFHQPLSQPMYGFPQAIPYPAPMMYQPPYGTFPGFSASEPAQFVPPPTVAPSRSPNSASRRSRAIEIKPPHEEPKKQTSSVLDPKSPTYEPVSRNEPVKGAIAPTPSPNKPSSWSQPGTSRLDKPCHALSTKPSLSSIDTTDFFPTNTHEHSTTRIAPQTDLANLASNENTAPPSTPERTWPVDPWSGRESNQSQSKESVAKLPSWPEPFGMHPTQDHVSKKAATRTIPHPIDSDGAWPLPLPKPMIQGISTFQDGCQAGYDHVGMSDHPEFLQGYVQGLLNFLSDESVKRRNDLSSRNMLPRGVNLHPTTLHGLAMSQDSSSNPNPGRGETHKAKQENIKHTKGPTADTTRRDSAYGQQQLRTMSIAAPLAGEIVEDPRQRGDFSGKQSRHALTPASSFGTGYRHDGTSHLQNDANRPVSNKSGGDALSSGNGRQFTGAHLPNGGYTTPAPVQRFHSNLKELDTVKAGQIGSSLARMSIDHRVSGLDGAMDELEGLVIDTRLEDRRTSTDKRSSDKRDRRAAAADGEEVHASCPKPFGGKSRHKPASSPTKQATGSARGSGVSSPANPPGSPKASGEVSPAKAKLDSVTNKFRRGKKDDPRTMSPEEKKTRSEKWRQRFQYIKKTEAQEIEQYNRDNNART